MFYISLYLTFISQFFFFWPKPCLALCFQPPARKTEIKKHRKTLKQTPTFWPTGGLNLVLQSCQCPLWHHEELNSRSSKNEDTQLLIFREFIVILENIGKVHVWRYGTFKTTLNFFPGRKCFCVFPMTSISILKERLHNRVSKAGIAVFHNYVCWIVAMLCKRKVKKKITVLELI